jgi:hypothetical protein
MACFEPHCVAHNGINIVEAVRQLQGFSTWTEALLWLSHEYPRLGPPALPLKPPARYDDWIKWPKGLSPIIHDTKPVGIMAAEALRFAHTQWGITERDAKYWELMYCTSGRYAWRIVIPIKLNGIAVAFLARTFRGGNPKYLASTHTTEMGRPGEALLFNLDAIRPQQPVILVEGSGDVMASSSDSRWGLLHRVPNIQAIVDDHGTPPVTIGLLGSQLTDEKVALLASKHPGPITVALDTDLPSTESMNVLTTLCLWGFDARLGTWTSGKDAGEGGQLVTAPAGGLRALVVGKLRRS